ncbi:IPT/TIG domain-containing protein [Reichenbachiella agariperforans]|uniref:IPT/TIG domain-containing protein n=1 Tax=Reichenbachiella agariperforans TaxID=156994 RepID=A0A1M6Q6R8_REIAG|nr:IPT/TIG domain-containing protein [Reichenbachiella agariperforans]SHK15979.1 IPT/TIG domain-containing protein [Reichenbachiella agariperforans]
MYKNLSKRVHLKSTWVAGAILLFTTVLISCSEDEGGKSAPIPTITAVSAESGEPGDDITITGTDLDEALTVAFGGANAAIVSNTSTEIVATVPEDAVTGKIRVTTEGGVAESAGDFNVIIVGAAVISDISPMSAQAGETVIITGTDMATISSVKIGEIDATVVGTTETTATITVGEGSALGLSSLTIVNEGGTATTSTEQNAFYVIKMIDEKYRMTFDNDDVELAFSGSPDTEESTAFGRSDDVTNVADVADALPSAIDGTFFHMEGYSSTEYSGSYICYVGTAEQEVGTFSDFFGTALPEDIYFNIQMNVGDLPEGYTGDEDDGQMVVGFRFRFSSDYYEYNATMKELLDMGFAPDENGWQNVSVPASLFVDRAGLEEFNFGDMNRYGLSVRRAYGGGTTLPLSSDPDAIFYSLSYDNASISVGGPASF